MIKNKNELKIAITGINRNLAREELKKYIKENSKKIKNEIKLDYKNPDLVLCYGGDGSLLYSERKYPEVLKVFINKKKGKKYLRKAFKNITEGRYKKYIKEIIKLELYLNNKKVFYKNKKEALAINDINIHYIPPIALRFYVKINAKKITNELIGDGIVISTPYGSRGYFKSITRKTFEKGIAIAFNNTTKKMKPMIIDDNSIIEILINRGKGVIAFDNNPRLIRIKDRDVIKIKKSEKKARIILV